MSIVNKSMDTGFSETKTEIFLSWIGKNQKVLDLGCYDGRDSIKFSVNNNEIYGIEVLPDPAKAAAELGIKVEIVDMENQAWPYENNFFDIVVCGDIIEHVIDVDKFLFNINKVLKPNGTLIVSTPNIASLGRRILLMLGKNPYIEVSWNDEVNGFPAVGHVRYFTFESLNNLLSKSGFTVEESTSDNFNFGPIHSKLIAKWLPKLSWRIIIKAKKS